MGWVAAGVGVLLLVIVVAAVALLHSSRFHAYILRVAEQKTAAALGSNVRLGNFDLSWSAAGPGVNLYRVMVQGSGPSSQPPLLEVSRIYAHVTISSFLHRNWYLSDLEIDRPVVQVVADKTGHTNLPASNKNSQSSGNTNLFTLGIRHFKLDQGQVYYNDQARSFEADLQNLLTMMSFAPAEDKYSGKISYRDGHIQMDGANPLPHSLDAQFAFTPSQFELRSASLRTPRSQLALQGTVQNYSQPIAHATYQARVDAAEFKRVLQNSSLPSGVIETSGVLDYVSQPDRPLLATARVNGELRSAELGVRQNGVAFNIRDIGAQYSIANGNAQLANVRAQLLGGSLAANLSMRDLTGATKSSLTASVRNISAADIQNLTGPATRRDVVVRGSVNAKAKADWGKTLDNLIADFDAKIAGAAQPAGGGQSAPVNGIIHARYDARRQILAIRQGNIDAGQTTLALNGTLGQRSLLQVQMRSNELHELETVASAFRAPRSTPLGLYGKAQLNATATGPTKNPQIRGALEASDLRIKQTAWKDFRAQFSASSSVVQITNGALTPATAGTINFQLSAALHHWAFEPSGNFQAQLKASGLRAGDLAKAAGLNTQVSGTLNANLQAHGTELAPIGNGTIQLSHASVSNEPINSVHVVFDGDGNSVKTRLQVSLPAGNATSEVEYSPKSKSFNANVRANGIKLGQLQAVKARGIDLTGVLNVNATGSGTLDNPQGQATIEVPQLQIRNQKVSDLKFTANVANNVATLDLGTNILGTHAGAHGTIQLTGDYNADLKLDTQTISFAPILAVYAPAQADDISGQTELHASLQGPLKNKAKVIAHVSVPQLNVSYKNTIKLAEAAPIQADYAEGSLDVKRSEIRGTGTDLTFQARVPAANTAPSSVLLQGTIDLQLAQLFSSDISSGGQLRFDINSYGKRSDPNVQGQVRIVNANFSQIGTPVGLTDGNGVLTLTRDRLDITKFEGKAGGGTVSASGGVAYRPQLHFDMGMKAQGVRILYEQSIRTTLNSNLSLTGNYQTAYLRGQVGVEQLAFTSNFDLMNFAGQIDQAAPPPPAGSFSDALNLDIGVQTPGGLNSSSRTLSFAGSANLQVRGTAAQPVLLGRVNLSQGDLIFRGNRYIVQSGTIDFRNPVQTEPVVNMSVNTTIDQYNILMHFWGGLDNLHTNYSSDPSLPPSDIINLIAFGKTAEASAANPTPGMLGAQSLIASQVSGQVTSRIEKLAGISQLSVDPVLGSTEQTPGARIAIRQRVSGKIFVTFATDVTATQQQTIKLEYQMSPRVGFNAVRDENGGFSFETNFKKNW